MTGKRTYISVIVGILGVVYMIAAKATGTAPVEMTNEVIMAALFSAIGFLRAAKKV